MPLEAGQDISKVKERTLYGGGLLSGPRFDRYRVNLFGVKVDGSPKITWLRNAENGNLDRQPSDETK